MELMFVLTVLVLLSKYCELDCEKTNLKYTKIDDKI